jgi:excisionase family DNA binding protein
VANHHLVQGSGQNGHTLKQGITKHDTLQKGGAKPPPPIKIRTTMNYERTMQMKNTVMTNTDRPVMLTIKEASEYVIGLSEYQIRKLCKSGKLPCITAGKRYLINRDVLLRFLGIELKYE